MRTDVEFNAEDGTTLRGWWYSHNDGSPRPGIVMAHGFSATKEMYMDDFAAYFHEAGFEVLAYDNRNFGASDGAIRGEIDPWRQVADYRDAITWFSTRDGVDPDRIGVWGSSYSGGHVLAVASADRRVKCVVSQGPLIGGLESARRLIRGDHWEGLRASFDQDRINRLDGKEPATIPVTWIDSPDELCALPTQDTHDFFVGPVRDRAPAWKNEITLRSMEMMTEYEPAALIERISPTPLLLVVAVDDVLTPPDLALEAYERAREPKKLLLVRGGHFDIYVDEAFDQSAPVQRDWFLQNL